MFILWVIVAHFVKHGTFYHVYVVIDTFLPYEHAIFSVLFPVSKHNDPKCSKDTSQNKGDATMALSDIWH